MKILKSIFVALLFLLIMQINILIQGKIYDAMPDVSDFVCLLLSVVFGVVTYLIFKKLGRNTYWVSTIIFAVIYILFICFISKTNYFMWLFKLTIPYYDETYYELDINAMVTGLAHTIAYVVSSITYFIKSKRV